MANIVDLKEKRPLNEETQGPEDRNPELCFTTMACTPELNIDYTGKDAKGDTIIQSSALSTELNEGVEIRVEGPQGEIEPKKVETHNR